MITTCKTGLPRGKRIEAMAEQEENPQFMATWYNATGKYHLFRHDEQPEEPEGEFLDTPVLCGMDKRIPGPWWSSGDPIEKLLNTPELCQACYRIATTLIAKIDALFAQLPPPETEEEVNEALREAGYNPDEVAEEFRHLAKRLLGDKD